LRWREVVAAFIKADYLWLIPAAVLYAISIWGKVVRWRLLFCPRQDIRQSRLFAAMMVGYMGNTILPSRLGEVARAYLVSKGEEEREGGEGVSVTLALSTIVVEKVLDISLCCFFWPCSCLSSPCLPGCTARALSWAWLSWLYSPSS
jgi:uncharacterized protein (TIRG00374 family)